MQIVTECVSGTGECNCFLDCLISVPCFAFAVLAQRLNRERGPQLLQVRFGAAVERRMISSGSNMTVLAIFTPLKRPKSNSAAFCPIASVG